MSRSGYSDDCEHLGLYRHAVDRAITGRRGQAFLRELITALDTMPAKRLAAGLFVDGDQVCAMGAVAVVRGLDTSTLDESEPYEVGAFLGIPTALAAEIAFENDERPHYRGVDETDEGRWQRMRDWATDHIVTERKPTPTGRCSWCCRKFTLRRGKIGWHKLNGVKCDGVGKAAMEVPSAD